MAEIADPFAALRAARVSDEITRPLAELMFADALVGSGRAARITEFRLRTSVRGIRRLVAGWQPPRRYSNERVTERRIDGEVRLMPNTREGIAQAIEARSPVDIDGTSFTISLADFKESRPYKVNTSRCCSPPSAPAPPHNGILHLGPDNYINDEIADLAVDTLLTSFAGSFLRVIPLI